MTMNEDQTLGLHCIVGGLVLYVVVCVWEWFGGKPQKLSIPGLAGIITASSIVTVGLFFWACWAVFAELDRLFLN